MTDAEAIAILKAAGIESAARDVQKLRGVGGDFEALIARRAAREPVSHLLGHRAFYAHDFIVTRDVLDPRPDTETLIEAALAVPFERVLDLGTGSGCILLSLLAARGSARGVGVDISAEALEVARRNRAALGLDTRAELARSDWFETVTGQFDLIVSNPPYIPSEVYETLAPEVRLYEPKLALTPGEDGLAAYRSLAAQAGAFLRQDGWLMVEIGFDQGAQVAQLFDQAGLTNVAVQKDLNGQARVVQGQKR